MTFNLIALKGKLLYALTIYHIIYLPYLPFNKCIRIAGHVESLIVIDSSINLICYISVFFNSISLNIFASFVKAILYPHHYKCLIVT